MKLRLNEGAGESEITNGQVIIQLMTDPLTINF